MIGTRQIWPLISKSIHWSQLSAALLLAFLTTLLSLPCAVAAELAADSCSDCHRDPKFLVTNRKLFDYFQKWQQSVHQQEGLSCADCHGGDPKATDKETAHGAHLNQAEAASAVNFRNIPSTCGECHPDIYAGYRKSKHFAHVLAKGQEAQGPTCVTCHGSIDAAVVNVNTVEQTCAACHNKETNNHPEVPKEAGELLYRFLSVQRFYRYITVRGEPSETRPFLKEADGRMHALATTWHTFDLQAIKSDTESLLTTLKAKRQEVGLAHKLKQSPAKQK